MLPGTVSNPASLSTTRNAASVSTGDHEASGDEAPRTTIRHRLCVDGRSTEKYETGS